MKSKKRPALACPIDAIGASACPMVACNGFCESHKLLPLGDVHSLVPLHCHGHRNGQQSVYMLHHRFVCCCPGGRRGNTERVVTQWRHPVASGEALDMLHQEMHSAWHWRTIMAIEMAHNGGAFVRRCRLFRLL